MCSQCNLSDSLCVTLLRLAFNCHLHCHPLSLVHGSNPLLSLLLHQSINKSFCCIRICVSSFFVFACVYVFVFVLSFPLSLVHGQCAAATLNFFQTNQPMSVFVIIVSCVFVFVFLCVFVFALSLLDGQSAAATLTFLFFRTDQSASVHPSRTLRRARQIFSLSIVFNCRLRPKIVAFFLRQLEAKSDRSCSTWISR